MSLAEFSNSLFYEKEDEVKQFLLKYGINKPENELGCVSSTLWFIVSVGKLHTWFIFFTSFTRIGREVANVLRVVMAFFKPTVATL
jgi:hypothetical protein